MKYTKLCALICIAFLSCGIIIVACRKADGTDPQPGPGTNTAADEIAARILFLSSSKKQGIAPGASGNNSLQISFKDTLYLRDEALQPIKFRHLDKSKDIAGVFFQVFLNGGASTFYYDAPELKQMNESDTVSVILIGIDPSNLIPPTTAEVKVIPYDKNKQPIAQFVRPIKVVKNEETPLPNNECGLEMPVGQSWRWTCSYILPETVVADTLKFYSDPNKVHSPQGQDITGACCNGVSRYPTRCPGDTLGIFDRKLHFATYYQINYEYFRFFNSGSFKRETSEDSPVPLPASSNFCAGGDGLVSKKLKQISYEGTWTITPAQIPADAPSWLKNKTQQLTFKTVSTTGIGFGNPGGVIHRLDCKSGILVLVQVSGGSGNLIKVYEVEKLGEPAWHS